MPSTGSATDRSSAPVMITGRPQRNSERARSTATCSGKPIRAVRRTAWLLTTEQSSPQHETIEQKNSTRAIGLRSNHCRGPASFGCRFQALTQPLSWHDDDRSERTTIPHHHRKASFGAKMAMARMNMAEGAGTETSTQDCADTQDCAENWADVP